VWFGFFGLFCWWGVCGVCWLGVGSGGFGAGGVGWGCGGGVGVVGGEGAGGRFRTVSVSSAPTDWCVWSVQPGVVAVEYALAPLALLIYMRVARTGQGVGQEA